MESSLLLNNAQPVEQVLSFLSRAISILDSENMPIAAARVDEARCAIRNANARLEASCADDVFPNGEC